MVIFEYRNNGGEYWNDNSENNTIKSIKEKENFFITPDGMEITFKGIDGLKVKTEGNQLDNNHNQTSTGNKRESKSKGNTKTQRNPKIKENINHKDVKAKDLKVEFKAEGELKRSIKTGNSFIIKTDRQKKDFSNMSSKTGLGKIPQSNMMKNCSNKIFHSKLVQGTNERKYIPTNRTMNLSKNKSSKNMIISTSRGKNMNMNKSFPNYHS